MNGTPVHIIMKWNDKCTYYEYNPKQYEGFEKLRIVFGFLNFTLFLDVRDGTKLIR